MNLEFRSISVKNFLSYGNQPTVIDLSKHRTTRVFADNGEGKTALFFDSIFFALFGSPLRDVKKHGITNFINGKDCVVELDFGLESSDIKIIRGLKPDRFEVIVDGEEKWKDLKLIEKQKTLDEFLQVRKSVIEQIAFIGSKNVPFMKRTPANRKGFVEFILDLQIATRMNDVAKSKIKSLKSQVSDVEFETSRVQQMHSTHTELLQSCRVPNQEAIKECQDFLEKNEPRLAVGIKKLEAISSEANELSNQINELLNSIRPIRNEIRTLEEASSKGVCPTCGSDHTVDPSSIEKLQADISEKEKQVEALRSELEGVNEKRLDLQKKVDAAQSKVDENKTMIKREQSYSTDQADELKKKIEESEEKLSELSVKFESLNGDLSEYIILQKSLQKGEAKSLIIDEFLPFVNERVNGYLDSFGVPLLIEFDSEFNETFRSRYRDLASYENFSTGEQAIIDLSMLMTWRDLAEKMTSIRTNLLVVDEYGNDLSDSNVERQGNIIQSLSGINFIGITPKRDIGESFDHHIKIQKVQNFSVIEQ